MKAVFAIVSFVSDNLLAKLLLGLDNHLET